MREYTSVEYTTDNYYIFPGFYESILTPHYLLSEDEDISDEDYKKYEEDVGKEVAGLLEYYMTHGGLEPMPVIRSIKFKSILAPTFYNYVNDSLKLDVEVNLHALENFCFTVCADEFSKYLKDFHSSYEGYVSFIETDLAEFIKAYYTNSDNLRCLQVMIEYYILTKLTEGIVINPETLGEDISDYTENIIDFARSIAYSYAEEVEDDTTK